MFNCLLIQHNLTLARFSKCCDYDFFKKVLYFLITICIFYVLYADILSVYAGVQYNDEAWLNLLIKKQSCCLGSSFAFYYKFLANWSIQNIRIFVFIFDFLCSFFGSLAIIVFILKDANDFKYYTIICFSIFSSVFCHLFYLGGFAYPNYSQLAFDFAMLGLGSFILGNIRNEKFWQILSGLFFSQIIFILPQASLLALILIPIVFSSSIKNGISFICGGIIGIALFFLIVQAPSLFFHNFLQSAISAQTHSNGPHGYSLLFKCCLKIMLFLMEIIFPPSLALFAFSHPKQHRGILKILLFSILFTTILHSLKVYTWKTLGVPAFPIAPFLILFVYLSLRHLSGTILNKKMELYILIIIFVLPISFCTLTDQGFANRVISHSAPIFASILAFIYLQRNKVANIFLCFLLLNGLVWGELYFSRTGMSHVYIDTIHSKIIDLPIDARVFKQDVNLLDLLTHRLKDRQYLVVDKNEWFIVYLLQKDTLNLSNFFSFSRDNISEQLINQKISKNEIAFICKKENMYDEQKIHKIMQTLDASIIHCEEIQPDTLLFFFE